MIKYFFTKVNVVNEVTPFKLFFITGANMNIYIYIYNMCVCVMCYLHTYDYTARNSAHAYVHHIPPCMVTIHSIHRILPQYNKLFRPSYLIIILHYYSMFPTYVFAFVNFKYTILYTFLLVTLGL